MHGTPLRDPSRCLCSALRSVRHQGHKRRSQRGPTAPGGQRMATTTPIVRFTRPNATPVISAGIAGWSGSIGATPGPGEKLIHFVRHAQGFHNIDSAIMKQPAGLDARLTEEGCQQCAALAHKVGDLTPELIVSSPLTRTLQTSALCFGKQLAAGVPLVALESVRETVNYLCDARRPLSAIVGEVHSATGITVDTSGCEHEHDELWLAYERKHGTQAVFGGHRESANLPLLAERARAAFAWLGGRSEREIIIVSHSAFLWNTLNMARVSRGMVPDVVDYAGDRELETWLAARFENTEMRTVLCEFL